MESESGRAPISTVKSPIVAPPTAPRGVFKGIRYRLIAGFLVLLPIMVTFWILYQLYAALRDYVLEPGALIVVRLVRGRQPDAELPALFEQLVAPLIALMSVILILYVLGLFVRSRLVRAIDAAMLRVPVVTVVYNVARNVVRSLQGQLDLSRFRRVVLVSFPHPGMRVPAFVTATCTDSQTGRRILCVYVPTTPVPASGYMIMVPEEEATDLDWTVEETVRAIISGGISAPETVQYFGKSAPAVSRT